MADYAIAIVRVRFVLVARVVGPTLPLFDRQEQAIQAFASRVFRTGEVGN